jgi:hypothetical protein
LQNRIGHFYSLNVLLLLLFSTASRWNSLKQQTTKLNYQTRRKVFSSPMCLDPQPFPYNVSVLFLWRLNSILDEVSPQGAWRSHSLDTPHSVGLPWTSDQPVAETSTAQHTTNIHAHGGIRTRNPMNRAAAESRLRPR